MKNEKFLKKCIKKNTVKKCPQCSSPVKKIKDFFGDDEYTINRINCVSFSLNGKGFIATGGQNTSGNDVWEYDPVTDLWEEKTELEGTSRMEAAGFVISNRFFITTGRSSSYYFDDLWEFEPDAEYNEYD